MPTPQLIDQRQHQHIDSDKKAQQIECFAQQLPQHRAGLGQVHPVQVVFDDLVEMVVHQPGQSCRQTYLQQHQTDEQQLLQRLVNVVQFAPVQRRNLRFWGVHRA
ncbi:hypothetical protein GALL_522850 [mine drainage metagenome]|uniref:Uncharacterized protein n=1 Tax=mine drainage metagenome TaxID=410659 RepID=A0A1J5PEC3_9ZZZZ